MVDKKDAYTDEAMKEFMKLASFGKAELELPKLSIFPNQLRLHRYSLSQGAFLAIKPKDYFNKWKALIDTAKEHVVYQKLFAGKNIQDALEKYLSGFPLFESSTSGCMAEYAYWEISKLRALVELTFFYRMHLRDIDVSDGLHGESFVSLVQKARSDIEVLEDAVGKLTSALEAIDSQLLELEGVKSETAAQIAVLSEQIKIRNRELGINRRTDNDNHPDRLLITRIGYNLFSHYGADVPEYESIVHQFCKPVLVNEKMKLGTVKKHLKMIPKLVESNPDTNIDPSLVVL